MPRNQPSDFSKSELKTLVKAIIKVDGYSRTRDGALYRNLYDDMILDQKRSATAMQLAFQEQISSNIYSLCSMEEAKKFEAHLYHEDIVAAKKNFQKQQMSNDAYSDDAEYFSNNDSEGSVSSEGNLPRKRRVPVAKGVAAKKMKTVQSSSGTKQKEKKNTQWNEPSDFSIGAVLSGKRKIDECGDKLLSTLDDYPSNPAKERSTRGAVNAKKQNMHPSVVLVDIDETNSKAETSKKSVDSAISINQILSGRAKVDLVGNSLIENTFPEEDGKITDYEDNDNDDAQKEAALPKSPRRGKTVVQVILDEDEANFSDEEAPNDFSIGAVLSGKRKIDECGDKLLSTLDDYPSNPAKERSTRGAVNAKKQNMHPSVVLVDIDETNSKAETSKKSVDSAISINQILSGRAKVDLVRNSLIESTFPEEDGKITDYEDNDNDDAQKEAALKSPRRGKTVVQVISDEDEANFSDEKAPNDASPAKKTMKEKSASPRKLARASPDDNSDDPTIRSSDLHSASSNSSKESADKEASTDEETIVIINLTVEKKKTSKKPQASSKSKKSPSKRKTKNVVPSDESDTEVEPAAEPSSRGSNLPMIAVAENVQGRKCYFRLVPMTNDEVNAIEGICIPYKLM